MTTSEGDHPGARSLLRDPATYVTVAAMVFVAASAIVHARLYRYNVIDDAYISFQYAKNLATGHGLVFNPGERVEGYTNFLWVALLTPLFALSRAISADFTKLALFVNACIGVGAVATMGALARRIFEGRIVPIAVAITFTALDGAFQAYAVSGMENHLFALFALLALWAHDAAGRRRALLVGGALAGVCLTRPDGVLFVFAWGLYVLSRLPPREGGTFAGTLRELASIAAVFTGVFGTYFAWRATYYGALLPNTFYLKVGDTFDGVPRGIEYTKTFVTDRTYVPVGALFAALFHRRPLVVWLLSYLAVHVAYVVYVGGDFYTGHRYYVALLPILYLCVAIAVDGVANHAWVRSRLPGGGWSGRPAAAAVAIGLSWLVAFTRRGYERGPYTNEILRWGVEVDENVRYMRWLQRPSAEGATMIVGEIGAAGFFADLRVIDVFGVVDPVVARDKPPGFGRGKPGHEKKAKREAMLAKNPKLIKWGYVSDAPVPRGYYIFTEFPDTLRVPGLWVRQDLEGGAVARGTEIHFEPGSLRSWSVEGAAFAGATSAAPAKGQGRVVGNIGAYLNSFARDDGEVATGSVLSPEIDLTGDIMVLHVGGGRDAERLRASLLIDGRRVFSATGHGHDILGRRLWKIGEHRGKKAHIEVVDASPTGHILVDEIHQWQLFAGSAMPAVFE